MWIQEYPGWDELVKLFADNGFDLDSDLANGAVIEKDGEPFDYNDLPAKLKEPFDKFSEQIEHLERREYSSM